MSYETVLIWLLSILSAAFAQDACHTACGPFASSVSQVCIGTHCSHTCECIPGTGMVGTVACEGVDEWTSDGSGLRRCTLDGSTCVSVALPMDWLDLPCPSDARNQSNGHCLCHATMRGWRCTVEKCTGGCSDDLCIEETATCDCRGGRSGCSCEVASPSVTKDTIIVTLTDNSTYVEIRNDKQTDRVIVTVIFVFLALAVFAVLIAFLLEKL